jgi:hypothetical protein
MPVERREQVIAIGSGQPATGCFRVTMVAEDAETTMPTPQRGDFVRVRTRRWLVEDERSAGGGLTALRLACVDDDAQGELVEVLWDAELDGSVLKDEGWASVSQPTTNGRMAVLSLPMLRSNSEVGIVAR